MIFVGTVGKHRTDRQTNAHRMFVNTKDGRAPYFVERGGPWVREFRAMCAVTADVNRGTLLQ